MTGLTLSIEGQAVTPAVDAEEKFQRLVRQWRKETRHLSSVKTISTNEAYQIDHRDGKSRLAIHSARSAAYSRSLAVGAECNL
jgi:hypothetical protein